MSDLLTVSQLSAGYGDSVVLEDVSFRIGEGEVVCLLGVNGAGKTTTMSALTGLIAATGGTVTFAGHDLLAEPAHRRVALGLALSPEGRQVFPNLSVEDNLRLGAFNRGAYAKERANLEETYALFPRLLERRRQKAGLMSGGEQQMLALGRAMMSCPRLLLLDEPSLGLAPKIVTTVFEAVARIAATGISILLVEQNTRAALSIATRGYVLSQGRIAIEDSAEALARSPLVQEAFIGRASGAANLKEEAAGA